MRSLHCYEPSQRQTQLCPLLARMTTREALEEKGADEFSIHIHGSLILQELMAFNKPIKVVSSLLALSPRELSKLLSDPCGSHITDAFMASTTIGEKSREGLVKSLKARFYFKKQ